MITVKEFQQALNARGADLTVDGIIGPLTLEAAMRLLVPSLALPSTGPIPLTWLPAAKMKRVIVHWTAGTHKAANIDRDHYHILIEGDGTLVRGTHSIKDNESTSDGNYAAHTLNCNAQSIAVSLCGMMGAKERPFVPGPQPITAKEWEVLPAVLAQLCKAYSIAVSPTTLLSHAEVQTNLGIKQKGKWDIAILPFNLSLNTAKEVGDDFRRSTLNRM